MAVKVFRLDLPPERVHRLVAEFERVIAAGLTHPGIAAPVATGIDGVVAYLEQNYIAADSLDILLRGDGAAAPADALRVAGQLAGSLDFAAAVNITHGALHPRDVLVSQDEIRITGLGVPRALERVGVAAPVRRPYTAPERIAGVGWDRRADIFSLAALMYEMLWGRRVSGTGAQAGDTLTELAGGDLAALRRVFARALADDPLERFDTALAFAEALKEAFPGASTAASRPASRQSTVRSRQSVEEPRLPLDEPDTQVVQALRPAHTADLKVRTTTDSPDDLEFSADEATRSAPAVAQILRPAHTESAHADRAPSEFDVEQVFKPGDLDLRAAAITPPAIARPPGGVMEPYQSERPSALEQSRSAIWPLALALVVGLGLGFGGGYAVGMRDRSAPASAAAVTPPDATAETVRLKPDTTTGKGTTGKGTTGTGTTGTGTTGTGTTGTGTTGTGTTGTGTTRKGTAGNEAAANRSNHGLQLDRGGPLPPSPEGSASAKAPASARASADRRSLGGGSQSDSAAPGRLLIRSTPAGARVFVDGRDRGQTPATVRDLGRGAHRIRLVRDGYVTKDRRVVITSSRPAQSLTIALARSRLPTSTRRGEPAERRAAQPASPAPAMPTPATIGRFAGALTIDSRPSGAKVFIDEKLVGTTPLNVSVVPAGDHAVRLERDGYRRWTSSVRVIASGQNRVTASLER